MTDVPETRYAKAPDGATAFEIADLMGRTTTWCARICQ